MRVLVVTVEPLFPAVHGGRVRTGSIALALAREGFEVRVLYPRRPEFETVEINTELDQVGLSWAPAVMLRRLSVNPWLGTYIMSRLGGVQSHVDDFKPDFIYWSHSYLAAVGKQSLQTTATQIVEFANIEANRFLSLSKNGNWKGRISAYLEHVKALRWERSVMREADMCVAISGADASIIKRAGGTVISVENALPAKELIHSPTQAPIVSVANWTYGPNRDGIDRFLRLDWPLVLESCPDAELILAGNGSLEVVQRHHHPRGVSGLGFINDLSELFATSAMFLAPARSGAGRQLKVADALGHCRTVVGPPFLNRERRSGLPPEAIRGAANLSAEIEDVLKNVEARHLLEKKISAYAQSRDWAHETAELRLWMNNRMAK